jgi:3-oxoadipate enol-lactonase
MHAAQQAHRRRMRVADEPGIIWPKDRSVVTEDGATLSYTFLGPDDGPVVALCSGFLCPDTWWHYLVPDLVDSGRRVLLFHYRGVATSTLPTAPRPHSYTVPRFAEDLRDIVEHEGITELTLAGHSMGVQVMLEAYRLLSDRVNAVLSLTGPYASPMRTLYGRREFTYVLFEPARLLFLLTPPPVLRLAWRTAWTRLPFLGIGRAVKAFGPRTSDELVTSYVEHAATLDPSFVRRVGTAMHAHSAEGVLADVDVPALVVIGGKDPFSPPRLGYRMAELMPDAVVRRAPNGTHGTILEYPELVNGWVLDFLEARVPIAAARQTG